MHAKGKPIDSEVDLDTLAAGTPGFTGADLRQPRERGSCSARGEDDRAGGARGRRHARHRGPEKKTRLLSEEERKVTAYHEMGHALVGHYLDQDTDVHKISVISRGQARLHDLAARRPLPDAEVDADGPAGRDAGRSRLEESFNEVTTGAANDLEKVTSTAKQMIMRFGMSEKLARACSVGTTTCRSSGAR